MQNPNFLKKHFLQDDRIYNKLNLVDMSHKHSDHLLTLIAEIIMMTNWII